ncbi:hypothetical protein MDA_GLEAN10004657 [Myotis davidii]|uniref:Uncharacterized protein n=1 Tax=Myotis davidii TaxID=225400 RepID=L5MBQ5_MYODS|nr:hypothetical protein MDA_GLEAN10004657 [Myotis davidii]
MGRNDQRLLELSCSSSLFKHCFRIKGMSLSPEPREAHGDCQLRVRSDASEPVSSLGPGRSITSALQSQRQQQSTQQQERH